MKLYSGDIDRRVRREELRIYGFFYPGNSSKFIRFFMKQYACIMCIF